jgi:predicted nuclease of predicted toxin-antitoxin system
VVIQFHLDENVHGAVAEGLRRRGIDVTTSKEANLIGASDKEQLAFAFETERVLVTHDDDLLRLHAMGAESMGIAFCHVEKYSVGQLVLRLANLWRTKTSDEMRGQIEFL